MKRPRIRRHADSLIGQVVAANVLLVTLALFAASLAAGLNLNVWDQRWQFLIVALATVLTLCMNLWMLQRRFAPLERLIERIESVDPADPNGVELARDAVGEIDRLSQSFNRLLAGIEAERRRGGQLVIRAQEEERKRLARDLHDEVSQALTAILLRLQALGEDAPERAGDVAELKRLVNQAMEELSGLARQLRPAALDDHGLVPAIDTQLRQFALRGVETSLRTTGDPAGLGGDEQIAVYRVAQEALTNAARHAGASRVEVALDAGGHGTELRVSDDGRGFDASRANGDGLGLNGMAERARLMGAELDVSSESGAGTTVRLRLP